MNDYRFLTVVALLLVSTSGVFGQQQIQAPVYEEGDFWKFSYKRVSLGYRSDTPSDVTTIVFKNGKFVINEATVAGTVGLVGLGAAVPGLREDLPWFQFPLEPGKKWTGKIFNNTKWRYDDYRAEGKETVEVSAGKFETLKLVRDRDASGGVSSKTVYYYSPKTKSSVKAQTLHGGPTGDNTEIELLEYGNNKKASR
jgi:hypothetical protein